MRGNRSENWHGYARRLVLVNQKLCIHQLASSLTLDAGLCFERILMRNQRLRERWESTNLSFKDLDDFSHGISNKIFFPAPPRNSICG